MLRPTILSSLPALALAFASALAADPEWLVQIDAVHTSNHDQARVEIAGYEPLYLDPEVYYADWENDWTLADPAKNLTYYDLKDWESGRKVKIAYSTKTGPVLLDPGNGQYTEIVDGLEPHPLDLYYEEHQGEGSTASVVVTSNKIIEIWDQEIARIYERLRKEFPDESHVFDSAEWAWNEFLEADSHARGASYHKEGSYYSSSSAESKVIIRRNHAMRIAKFGRF